MPVEWARLSDVARKTHDTLICCRCGEPAAFEDAWLTRPVSVAGRQMLQGYVHCRTCTTIPAIVAWRDAHNSDPWTADHA